jgi:IS5 family transposase
LLHGSEERVYGDSAYASQGDLIPSKAPDARDCTNQRVREGSATEHLDRILNRVKSRVRSQVEHVFAVIKLL